MKNLTVEYLKKLKACQISINKFFNTKELHTIDIDNINTITVGDMSLFNDINWLILNSKGLLKIKSLTYKNSTGYTEEYTYDERNNILTYKDSDGYTYEKTYDERNNILTYKDSDGYTYEYTYDERNNILTHKNSNGYTEEYTYDERNNILTYKDSKGYTEEKTYDKRNNILTQMDIQKNIPMMKEIIN